MTPADPRDEARRVLADLEGQRFDPVGWTEVDAAARQLEDALAYDDGVAIRAATTLLSQAAFEGKVRGRFTRDLRGRSAPVVAPTKRTSVLPVVGLVCGLPILLIGWLLGGGLVLAFAIVFELFILVVAVAGSRVAHRSPTNPDDGAEPPTDPPEALSARLDRIEALLD